MQESELDNQVVEVVVGVSPIIKEKSSIKEEKSEAEEEKRWQKRKRSSYRSMQKSKG